MDTIYQDTKVSTEVINLTAGNIILFALFYWKYRDVRLDDFFLMASICVTYIFIAKVVTPVYMGNREPMDCTLFNRMYNLLLVMAHLAT
jgi:hypothetical protein